jgi:hypothetical protein
MDSGTSLPLGAKPRGGDASALIHAG